MGRTKAKPARDVKPKHWIGVAFITMDDGNVVQVEIVREERDLLLAGTKPWARVGDLLAALEDEGCEPEDVVEIAVEMEDTPIPRVVYQRREE